MDGSLPHLLALQILFPLPGTNPHRLHLPVHPSGSLGPGISVPGHPAQLLGLGVLPPAPQTRPSCRRRTERPAPSVQHRAQPTQRADKPQPLPHGSLHAPWERRVPISDRTPLEKWLKFSFRICSSSCSCAPCQETEGTGPSGEGCVRPHSPSLSTSLPPPGPITAPQLFSAAPYCPLAALPELSWPPARRPPPG